MLVRKCVSVCVCGVASASASVSFMAIKHVEFCRFICQSGAQLKTHNDTGQKVLRKNQKDADERPQRCCDDAEIVLNPPKKKKTCFTSSYATLWGS